MAAVRHLLNIIGGLMTLTSVALPWRILNGVSSSVLEVWSFGFGLALIIPFLILSGACFSVLSRYGGVVTVAGAIAYVASLPAEFGLGSNSTQPPSSFGVGYWVVWAGALISLTGKSWNLPFFQKLFSRLSFHGAREPTKANPPGSTELLKRSSPAKST